jgi:hypothetical protein
MSAEVYSYYSGNAFPGELTRRGVGEIVQDGFFTSALLTPADYGLAVKLDGAKISKFAADDLASEFFGVLLKVNFAIGGDLNGAPNPASIQSILTKGFVAIKVEDTGVPVRGGAVYLGVVADNAGLFFSAQDAAATAAAKVGNTGNGTISAIEINSDVSKGVYVVRFTAATQFLVTDPSGVLIGSGVTGAEFDASGLVFTITAGGTAFVANDAFNLTVATDTQKLENVVFAVSGKDSNGFTEIEVK